MYLLSGYLRLDDKLIDSFDIVTFPLDIDEFKKKTLLINNKFGIIPQIEEQKLVQEIKDLMTQNLLWARVGCLGSSISLLDLIEMSYPNRFPLLSQIMRYLHSLPTTSANVEQSFSVMKLFKTDLRNNLKEETLQSLLLIHQKYQKEPIIITSEIFTSYLKMKQKLNEGKSASQKPSQPNQENLQIENENEKKRDYSEIEVDPNEPPLSHSLKVTRLSEKLMEK